MKFQKNPQSSRFSGEHALRIVMLICAAAVLVACNSSAQPERPARNAQRGPARVQLFDVYSGLALVNAAVEVTSDNGIRCEQIPCPTNGQTWLGRTDDAGVVIIPPSAFLSETYVNAKDYRGIKLDDDLTTGSSGVHQMELYPEWLFDEQHDWTRGYKLVDGRSGKVLSNISARIEFLANDWPTRHGGISGIDITTNPRGYVFFSFLRKPEAKPGEVLPEAPEADWVTPEAWVEVSGYRKVALNYFEGNDAERFTTRLQRQ